MSDFNPDDYVDGNRKYYHSKCRNCGWEGSSKFLGVYHYHDDGDVYCKHCNSMDIDDSVEMPQLEQENHD